jgi:hypothetical protein
MNDLINDMQYDDFQEYLIEYEEYCTLATWEYPLYEVAYLPSDFPD